MLFMGLCFCPRGYEFVQGWRVLHPYVVKVQKQNTCIHRWFRSTRASLSWLPSQAKCLILATNVSPVQSSRTAQGPGCTWSCHNLMWLPNEDTIAQNVNDLPKDIQLVWSRTGIRNQVTWFLIQCCFFCTFLHPPPPQSNDYNDL